ITIVAEDEATDATAPSAAPVTVGQTEHGAPAEPPAGEGSVLVGYGTGGHVQSRRRAVRQAHRERVAASVGVIAKPPIRKLARDLGVDLADVVPTGPAGDVTRDDVLKHAEQASVFRNIQTPDWGTVREETIPVERGAGAASATPVIAPAAPTPPADEDREETI